MKKILFYVENNWAFGKIHNDLIKALYPEVYCDILDWRVSYTPETFEILLDKYDYIVTSVGALHILKNEYKVPLNKIIAVLHSSLDILSSSRESSDINEDFNNLKGFACVSDFIKNISINSNIERIPKTLPIGIFTENYSRSNFKGTIEKVGYYSRYATSADSHHYKNGIKRGFLARQICKNTELIFNYIQDISFLGTEILYKDTDLYIVTSLTESLPMIALECMSSGIPIIGTPVGILPDIFRAGAGIELPFEERDFILEAVDIVNELKSDVDKYKKMSDNAWEYRETIDWRVKREPWINYINSL